MKRQTRMAPAVICATDLTGAGDEALRQASRVAAERKGRLVVLHVLPDPLQQHPLLPLGRKPRYAALAEAHMRATDAVRTQLVRAIGPEAASDAEIQIEHGTPHVVIISRSEAARADLIVVGASAPKVGREAERVVRYAHAPVLVARSGPTTGHILAATDFSDAALPAVKAAADWTRRRRSSLTLLHVVDLRPLMTQPDLGGAVAVPLTAEVEDSLIASARERVERALRRVRVAGRGLVATGDPAAVILEQAARLAAELVVLGTAGATGLTRLVLGSVAETVVHRAPCSTLVVRLNAPVRRSR